MPVDKSQIIEKESVVVDGIELTADWNRMFMSRVVSAYEDDLMERTTSMAKRWPQRQAQVRVSERVRPRAPW